jgi:hypothetical protein
MKILNASPRFEKPHDRRQLKDFLDKCIIQMHIGTLDDKKIQTSIWYHYDSENNKLYFNIYIQKSFMTSKKTKKKYLFLHR